MTGAPPSRPSADVVLVGGGHAHVQVLRRWMMRPVPDAHLWVVLDRPEAVYSGMVPGCVAGDYDLADLEIDVVPLARRARASVVLSAATRIDPVAQRIELEDRPPLHYDFASLDVGSTVAGLDVPGVREHALATRPIRDFVDLVEARLTGARAEHSEREDFHLVIVGAGAAGVELALTLHARLLKQGVRTQITVATRDARILEGYPEAARRRVARILEQRGVRLRCSARVDRVEKDQVFLGVASSGSPEACRSDLTVWATGAAPHALCTDSALPLDERGFVRVRSTLQVVGHDTLFAVGDCASLDAYPWVRKAGVYAVRQGPVLERNLRASCAPSAFAALRVYEPQRDFLSLLNLGGRRAIASKWGLAGAGRLFWELKDRIDRRFMSRFRVLSEEGELEREFPSPEAMGMAEMPCGGCAAKVAESALSRALARLPEPLPDETVRVGLAAPDDVAALVMPGGDVLLATVDAFRAFTDDPWWVGRVAATNAASDVWAKGAQARHAMALVTVPDEGDERAEETLFQVLSGIRCALDPHGIALVGGHSTVGPELFVGLSISGAAPGGAAFLAKGGAAEGDQLILTKPLGTGVVLASDMQGRARGVWLAATLRSMARANASAGRIARDLGARGCTDVSGFGLAGHLCEMLRAARKSAQLELDSLPALAGSLELLGAGRRSSFHAQNEKTRRAILFGRGGGFTPRAELLFDPQTSSGLLIAVPAQASEELLRRLHAEGDVEAARIGEVRAWRDDGALITA